MGVLSRKNKKAKKQADVLKIVHPKHVLIFSKPILASEIMSRYPRHCITRPDVFEFPWIVLRPESILVPGKVFYLVPYHTMDSLLKSKRNQLSSLNPRLLHEHHSDKNNHESPTCLTNGQQESCSNGDRKEGSRDSSYETSFYKLWDRMRQNIIQGNGEDNNGRIYCGLDSPLATLGSYLNRDIIEEQYLHGEIQKIRSCMRKPDSLRKKLRLKVSFASPLVVFGSRTATPECSHRWC